MLGLRVVIHAIKMLVHDVGLTLRLTLLPYLIATAASWGLGYLIAGPLYFSEPLEQGGALALQPRLIAAALSAFLVYWLVVCWMAVGWHRYSLLNERPQTAVPPLNQAFVGAYVGASIRVFLCMLLIAALAGVLMSIAAVGGLVGPTGGQFMPVILVLALTVVAMRLGLVLPAAAIGQPLALRESWAATRGYLGTVIAVVFLTLMLGVPSQGLVQPFLVNSPVVAAVITVALQWLNIVIGLSVLTTLYGICIEKRSLD